MPGVCIAFEERDCGAPARKMPAPCGLVDLRFRALVGEEAWAALTPAIRRRFSKYLGPDVAITYAGRVVESRHSLVGKLVAKACRLIGSPLPLHDDVSVPAVVTVTEDSASGGQFWTRIYGQARGFPQVVHSSKRFGGPTGLEEFLGSACGIALTVTADRHALRFLSDHYFLALGRVRLRLPSWLGPGRLEIIHIDEGEGSFLFVLMLRHPLAGELIRQVCQFRDGVVRKPRESRHA